MTGLAQLRGKPDRLHEGFVIPAPYRMPVRIAAGNNALHVVCQNSSRNAESLECMDHPDEQVILQAFKDDIGIRHSLTEQDVDDCCVAGENCIVFFPAGVPMYRDPESVLLCIT